jgi:hypothetical protein
MSRYNYFSTLERLGDAQLRTSTLLKSELCSEHRRSLSEISDINRQANSLCSEIDSVLFSDSSTPISKASISRCAHGLSSVIGAAFEVAMLTGCRDRISGSSALCDEMSVCSEIAEHIYGAVLCLGKTNSRNALPDTYACRLCLNKGRGVHSAFASRLLNSRTDQSALILGIEHYRRREAQLYDMLIETLLERA